MNKLNNQRISKIYDYRDTDGHLIFQVIRFEPKGFSQRRPFEGGFVWGLTEGWYRKDARSNNYYKITDAAPDKSTSPHPDAVWFDAIETVLYRLQELMQGIRAGETIFICEGEKDADNLNALGFIATTCPMSAGKWRSTYSEALKGCREAIVLTDKDTPGRAHAESVASSLYSTGIPVKIIEVPDIEGAVIKDVSDWLLAGGTCEELKKLVENCPEWKPPKQYHQNVENRPSLPLELRELINLYGEPFYLSRDGSVTAINESFWAGLHYCEHIELYEPDEQTFYRYSHDNGLYSVVSEDVIKREISVRMLDVSRQLNLPSLERKRNNATLNNIVAQLKGISERKNTFQRNIKTVHLANGVIVFNDSNEADFCEFSPQFYSRNQSPIPFDPNAECERFFNELLYPSVSPDDAVLIQKYAGLCLLGNNLIQRLLILDGLPGRSKSTLTLIIQKLVGQCNVTELRTRQLNERFELYRYLKKTLLVGVDVRGWFLSEKGAHVIKGLVGGDWFDAEKKGGTGNFPCKGNFCILITSNSRLHVRLDGDIGAWKRRLLVVRFGSPAPAKKIPDFGDLLIREEGSGILNWALQGLGLLFCEIDEYGDIRLTQSQESIVDGLLAESESLKNFLKESIIHQEQSDLATNEIVEAYAEYCPIRGWNPKPITVIHNELEGLMLELFGTSKSNSIKRDDKCVKGFRRVGFKTKGGGNWN